MAEPILFTMIIIIYINYCICNINGMKPLNYPPQRERQGGPPGRFGAASLPAQVGAHAASRSPADLAALELAPPHAGIMRILGAQPAITQQALATALGIPTTAAATPCNAGVDRTRGTRTPAGAACRAQ